MDFTAPLSAPEPRDNEYCIIGGGASGSALLIALARKLQDKRTPPPVTALHLIDPQGFGHGGTAYGLADEKMLLNSVRTEMSPWQPEEFHRYCVAKGLGDDPLSFETRATYRDFLKEKTAEAIASLRDAGIKVFLHKGRAAIDQTQKGYVTVSPNYDDGARTPPQTLPLIFRAENVILTTGYGPNSRFEALAGIPGFVNSLYPPQQATEALAQNRTGHIVILGGGAALYDALRLLPEDFTGKITAIAPRPQTLAVRDTALETPERESRKLDIPLPAPASAEGLAVNLRQIFRQAVKEDGFSERRAALSLAKQIPSLLENIPATEAAAFRKTYLSSLFHLCTPVPPSSHAQLQALAHQGRFEIIRGAPCAGDIKAETAGGFSIRLPGAEIPADAIINCTGHDPLNVPVVQSLLDKGLAQIDAIFGGVKTDKTGYRLCSGIACIGPATHKGLHGMESFYPYIEDIANEMAQPRIKENHPVTRLLAAM